MDKLNSADDAFAQRLAALRQRMPTLDGLRAFAILSVLWHNSTGGRYHGNTIIKLIGLLSNAGWLGVQLFFVLSGFLITGILLDSTHASKRFINFYGRRVLRIFPPYYTLLIVICLILPFLFPDEPMLHENLDKGIWYWLFVNNWTSPFIGEMPTLPHLWSLAVEEQFYIFWPACVFLLPRRVLPWLCASAVVIALALRFGLTLYDSEFAEAATYKFTFARWDALTLGAGLAFFMRDAGAYEKLRRCALPIFCCSLLYLVAFIAINRNFAATGSGFTPLNQTMSALFFAAVIFYSLKTNTGPSTRWQIFLMNPVLQSIGKYSYAMYLFHMPLILFFSPRWAHYRDDVFSVGVSTLEVTSFSLLILISSYCLAWLSWVAIERPCLKLKRFFV